VQDLPRGGYGPTRERVQTQSAFCDALQRRDWDEIISDHSIPGYGGPLALADLSAGGKEFRVILVTRSLAEAGALAAMKAGAHDDVLTDNLSRLAGSVEREVRGDAGSRRATLGKA
jgi:DNA-binding NarL/FixJ family response regulator